MSFEQLDGQFAIPGQLRFSLDNNGLPFIHVDNQWAEALISVYGGQILSFRPHSESRDLLFLAPNAVFSKGKAIRGGIPVCWPWFGKRGDRPEYPGHGIARIALWRVLETRQLDCGQTLIRLNLNEQHNRQSWWAHPFELELSVTVGKELIVELTTRNTGVDTFEITQCFHAYFQVGHIEQCLLTGLENFDYIDNLDAGRHKNQIHPMCISEALERVYQVPDANVQIVDTLLRRKIAIRSFGTESMVVWNPWTTFSAAMFDLTEADYQHFICVEPGHVGEKAIKIAPTSEARFQVVVSISND